MSSSWTDLASPRLWREMCVAFAKQLEDSGFFHRAASYLLAVHKVQEAVEMLVRHGLFRYQSLKTGVCCTAFPMSRIQSRY